MAGIEGVQKKHCLTSSHSGTNSDSKTRASFASPGERPTLIPPIRSAFRVSNSAIFADEERSLQKRDHPELNQVLMDSFADLLHTSSKKLVVSGTSLAKKSPSSKLYALTRISRVQDENQHPNLPTNNVYPAKNDEKPRLSRNQTLKARQNDVASFRSPRIQVSSQNSDFSSASDDEDQLESEEQGEGL